MVSDRTRWFICLFQKHISFKHECLKRNEVYVYFYIGLALLQITIFVICFRCDGKRECIVTVSTETFKSDPCPDTSKYLYAVWECVPNGKIKPSCICSMNLDSYIHVRIVTCLILLFPWDLCVTRAFTNQTYWYLIS